MSESGTCALFAIYTVMLQAQAATFLHTCTL